MRGLLRDWLCGFWRSPRYVQVSCVVPHGKSFKISMVWNRYGVFVRRA